MLSCADSQPTAVWLPVTAFATLDTPCLRLTCSSPNAGEEAFIENVIANINSSHWHCDDLRDSLQAYLDGDRIFIYPKSEMGDTAGWVDPLSWTMGLADSLFYHPSAAEKITHEGDHANRHGHHYNNLSHGWTTTHPTVTFNELEGGKCLDQ